MAKIGRNDPCPCGSGKKYKKCHLVQTKASPSPFVFNQAGAKTSPSPGPNTDESELGSIRSRRRSGSRSRNLRGSFPLGRARSKAPVELLLSDRYSSPSNPV